MVKASSSLMPVFFILFLFNACEPIEDDITALFPVKSVHELSDDYLLTDIRLIQESSNNIYLNDWTRSHIVALDNNLTLTQVFGQEGKGPGEFTGVGSFNIYKDQIYTLDDGGARIHVFQPNGELIKTLKNNNIPTGITGLRFAVLGENIYLPSSIFSESDLVILDRKNGELIRKVKLRSENSSVGINQNLLITFKNQIVVINKMIPSVSKLTKDGDLIGEYDLTNIVQLNDLWAFYEQNKIQTDYQNYKSFIVDAYIDNSNLFILCSGWPGRDNFAYIIQLHLDQESFEFERVFKIQGANSSARFFKTIAVFNNRLFAIERRSMTINEYNLSTLN